MKPLAYFDNVKDATTAINFLLEQGWSIQVSCTCGGYVIGNDDADPHGLQHNVVTAMGGVLVGADDTLGAYVTGNQVVILIGGSYTLIDLSSLGALVYLAAQHFPSVVEQTLRNNDVNGIVEQLWRERY